MKQGYILRLAESGIMIALAIGLSLITLFRAPQGGSVTAASMVPLIIISYRHGAAHGILTGVVYAIVHMLVLGFWAPPVETVLNFGLVIFLDYIVAYGVLGLAILFAKFENKQVSVALSCLIVSFLRFVCHYLSGIMIWGYFAPEGQSPYVHSLLYNGSYMLFEAIITAVAMIGLVNAAPQLFEMLNRSKKQIPADSLREV